MSKQVLLLSGERGAGKTTVCQRVLALAQAAGIDCAGLLTLRGVEPEQREVLDVRSGHRRRLTVDGPGLRIGRFTFDPQVIEWGSNVLRQAVPCRLLLVDELGPLEIERGAGWCVAFDVLQDGRFDLAVVVVRPELLTPARQRWVTLAVAVLTVTLQNRDELPAVLIAHLGPL